MPAACWIVHQDIQLGRPPSWGTSGLRLEAPPQGISAGTLRSLRHVTPNIQALRLPRRYRTQKKNRCRWGCTPLPLAGRCATAGLQAYYAVAATTGLQINIPSLHSGTTGATSPQNTQHGAYARVSVSEGLQPCGSGWFISLLLGSGWEDPIQTSDAYLSAGSRNRRHPNTISNWGGPESHETWVGAAAASIWQAVLRLPEGLVLSLKLLPGTAHAYPGHPRI